MRDLTVRDLTGGREKAEGVVQTEKNVLSFTSFFHLPRSYLPLSWPP